MITEFEERLADLLGARLPAPFGGRVAVSPGPVAGPGPSVLLAARALEVVEPDFGSGRLEVAPGSDDPRRVVRARCTVSVEVRPGSGQGRAQQMLGVDALLFELDAPAVRDGSALATGDPGDDPGFLIERMRVLLGQVPSDPQTEDAGPVALTLQVEGWFWPVGVAGEAGVEMRIRLRQARLPLQVVPGRPDLVAGGPAVELTVELETTGTMGLDQRGAPPIPLPFGSIALSVMGPGGRPGAGTLTGGSDGNDGVRVVTVADGRASVTYEPPADAATDELLVGLGDGEGGLGLELGRMALRVREA
jgi:hypothetical protein